jgi:hypothetical protein
MNAPVGWSADIARALAVEGRHLEVGRYGYTLYLDRGCRLSGYDLDGMKAACIAAGLPVIDSRSAIRGPIVAVGEPASEPPWHALSYAPLRHVAELYRAAGAEIHNLPCAPAMTPQDHEAAPDS